MVFMDIVLKGEIDGIEAAEEIRTQFNIPIVFVTAHMDEDRLERAKLTLPFGYVLKPFQDRELKATIEMALYTSKIDAERRQTEQIIQRQRKELQTIFDSVPASVFYKDKGNRLIRVNKTLADALGLPKEEIEGKSASEISPHEDEKYWEDDKEVMSSGKAKRNIVEPLVTPKGTRWLQTDKIPYKDDQGNIIGVIGFAIDITDRKQAEEAMRQAHNELELRVEERTAELSKANEQLNKEIDERKRTEKDLRLSEERYRTVVEDQTEVICRFRVDGAFIFVNDVYCRFFGKSSQELFGKKWQPVTVSEDVAMIEEKLETLSEDNPIVIIENRVYSGSGEIRWMQFVNRGFFGKEGQLIEIQSVGRDINDRKLAEKKLTDYRNHLEEIVKERTAEVEDANLKLQREISERKQAE